MLHIFEHFDPDGGYASGIDNVIQELAKNSKDTDLILVGVTNNPNYQLGKITFHPKLKNASFLPVAKLEKQKFKRHKYIPHSIKYGVGLLRFRKNIQPQIIHSHRIEIGFLVAIFWPKAILIQFIHNARKNLTNSRSDSAWKHFQIFYRILEDIVRKKAKKILVFNQKEFERLSLNNSSVYRCFTWYDPKIFNPKQNTMDSKSTIQIAWVGRLDSQKNPSLLIDIALELKNKNLDFEIHIYGKGELEVPLRKLVEEKNLTRSIFFEGLVIRELLADKLKSSDILLMTSIYEGSPTILVEGLACGIPVVCTQESDPDQVIQNGTNGYRLHKNEISEITKFVTNALNLNKDAIANSVKNRSALILIPELLKDSLMAH